MACFQFDNVRFSAIVCAAPAHVQAIDTSPEHPNAKYIKSFIRQTGIRQRHISVTEQTCTDTGYVAALKALDKTKGTLKVLMR